MGLRRESLQKYWIGRFGGEQAARGCKEKGGRLERNDEATQGSERRPRR